MNNQSQIGTIEQNHLVHLQQAISFVKENQFKDHLIFFIKHGNNTEKAGSICSVSVTKSLYEMIAEQHLYIRHPVFTSKISASSVPILFTANHAGFCK